MKKHVDIWNCAGEILRALPGGVLLNTQADGKCNTMTIGWGTLGIDWRDPIFVAFVRESRFTRQLLEKNPEFTVSIPNSSTDRQILSYCGKHSGRDVDKIQALGLTLETPEAISVPGIRELPLTLECRVIYHQLQDGNAIAPSHFKTHYPPFGPQGCPDLHIAYYGQIVSAYRIEP